MAISEYSTAKSHLSIFRFKFTMEIKWHPNRRHFNKKNLKIRIYKTEYYIGIVINTWLTIAEYLLAYVCKNKIGQFLCCLVNNQLRWSYLREKNMNWNWMKMKTLKLWEFAILLAAYGQVYLRNCNLR
jgi:hypothetical protein